MYNHAAYLLKKMNDPATSREEYMKCWHEYQDGQQRQNHINEEAKRRHDDQR